MKTKTPDHIKEKWNERIEYCNENSEHLTSWESDFIDSIEERRSFNRDLTPKQVSVLYSIFHKVEWRVG